MSRGWITLFVFAALSPGGCGIREHNAPRTVAPGPSNGEPTGGSSAGGSGPGNSGGTSGSAGSVGSSGGASGAGGSASGRGGSSGGGTGGSSSGTGGSRGADAQGSAPPDDGTLVIAGTRVPREQAMVILLFGHSNMLGHGETPEELRPYFFTPQDRLWSYRGNNTFMPAIEPTSSGGRSRDTAGPGMGLLKAAAALAPADIHFISIGLGVGSATTQDWSKGGLHYSRVMDVAVQLKGKVTFAAAVIMLGITDRHMPLAQQSGFADRVTRIAADVRADLATPDLPILHTDYEVESTGDLAVDGEVGMRFRPLILTLPMRIPRCAIIPTDGLGMEDDHHFNMAGQKDWSDRAMKILVDKGWAPWPAR